MLFNIIDYYYLICKYINNLFIFIEIFMEILLIINNFILIFFEL